MTIVDGHFRLHYKSSMGICMPVETLVMEALEIGAWTVKALATVETVSVNRD